MRPAWPPTSTSSNRHDTTSHTTPLVPALNLPQLRAHTNHDLAYFKRAANTIRNHQKQTGDTQSATQQKLVATLTEVRARAHETRRRIKHALAIVHDGTPEHAAVLALDEQFIAAMHHFKLQPDAPSAGASLRPAAPPPSFCAQSASSSTATRPLEALSAGAPHHHSMDIDDAGEQQRVAELVAVNEGILAEREAGIGNIHKTVNQVAEIFQDLALLVSEQGEQIDNIQTNIEVANMQTQRGVRELTKANRSQKRARTRLCCVAGVCIGALVLLLLILKATGAGP